MAVSFITVKCPECGASLSVSSNGTRDFFYCDYCGAKVKLVDSNTTTYRYVDEARMREAELNAQIRLKELELQSNSEAAYEKRVAVNRRFFKKRLLIYIAIAFAGYLLSGLIGFNNSFSTMLVVIGSLSLACAFYGSIGHGIAMLIKKRK